MKRVKRALAGFLKDELLDYVSVNAQLKTPFLAEPVVVLDNTEFETIVMEQLIDINPGSTPSGMNDPLYLDRRIEQAKHQFAQEVVEHIHVEAQDLTKQGMWGKKHIRLVLRVQKKKL